MFRTKHVRHPHLIGQFLLLALSANVFGSEIEIARAGLSPDQIETVKTIEQNFRLYDVAVMGGEVSGIGRTVVLLGETHVKSKEAAELGGKILDNFRAVGVEGIDVTKYWGGKTFLVTLRAIFSLTKILSFNTASQESTLNVASYRSINRLRVAVLSKFVEAHNIRNIPPDELENTFFNLEGHRVSGAKILSLFEEFKINAEAEPLIFWLEENHRVGLGENIVSVALPAVVGATMYFAGKSIFAIGRSAVRGHYLRASTQAILFAGPSIAIVGAMQHVPGRMAKAASLPYTPYSPLLNERNQSMTDNIAKAFDAHPEMTTMLVIVGRAHVPGLRQLMESQFQFRTVATDQIERVP